MKYLYLLSFLIFFISCKEENVIETIIFPYVANAQIIENPEDLVPITLKYENDQPFYFVGTKKSTLRDLEDSIISFFNENPDLATKIYETHAPRNLNILFKSDSTVRYKDIYDFTVISNKLRFYNIVYQTQSLDKKNIWGVKRKNYEVFDETCEAVCSQNGINTGAFFMYSSTTLWYALRKIAYKNNDIIIEPPRMSEPPAPPPPPFSVEMFTDEYDDDYHEGLNPILIHYSTNRFNYINGTVIENKYFSIQFENLLNGIKRGEKRTIEFNPETNKLADISIFLSFDDNVPYYKWLEVRQKLTDLIRKEGLDELIRDSNTFEFELMKEALELR